MRQFDDDEPDSDGVVVRNVSLFRDCRFVRCLRENGSQTDAGGEPSVGPSGNVDYRHAGDFSIGQADLGRVMGGSLRGLLDASIMISSTTFGDADPGTGAMVFIGSKTKTVLLKFVKQNGWPDYKKPHEDEISR